MPDESLDISCRISIRPDASGYRRFVCFFFWKATVRSTKKDFDNRLRRGCQAQPDLHAKGGYLEKLTAKRAKTGLPFKLSHNAYRFAFYGLCRNPRFHFGFTRSKAGFFGGRFALPTDLTFRSNSGYNRQPERPTNSWTTNDRQIQTNPIEIIW